MIDPLPLQHFPRRIKEIVWLKVNDAIPKVIRGYSGLSKMEFNNKEE